MPVFAVCLGDVLVTTGTDRSVHVIRIRGLRGRRGCPTCAMTERPQPTHRGQHGREQSAAPYSTRPTGKSVPALSYLCVWIERRLPMLTLD